MSLTRGLSTISLLKRRGFKREPKSHRSMGMQSVRLQMTSPLGNPGSLLVLLTGAMPAIGICRSGAKVSEISL
ncbi:hypothetical protein M422DRAFT_25258 [Sphaerobolus stellatus SS14]|nr:hypothetical protein M422DRAFT_25258 [Sphaerobolus stellatus SS14]